MKRIILFSMILLLGALSTANAAITVKFTKPASWTSVNVYTWGPEALGGWPGKALTESNGTYNYTFNDTITATNVIFNNGTGEQCVSTPVSSSVCLQAADIKNAGGEYPVNIIACTSNGITVKFKKPAGWTNVSLYTWGPEALGGWPGAALTETNGWYTYTFDAAFTGANLIFNNGGAGEQCVSMPVSSDVCLQASDTKNTGGEYPVSVIPCVPPGITVKFQKPASWTNVSLYTWGPEVLGGWPGATLTATNGWYTYTFDPAFTGANLIFNNGGAGEQCVGMPVSTSICIQASDTKNTGGEYPVNVVPCVTGGITVKFMKPASWTAVNLYAYVNGSPIIGGWPGPSLTESNGWYSYTFDASVTGVNVIFNQNGTPQAADTYITTSSCFSSTGLDLTPVICGLTEVNEQAIRSLNVYPNPISDVLNFSAPENISKVAIYSVTGENMISIPSLSKTGKVNVSSLKPGIYFVNIHFADGKQQVEKITKL